MGRPGTFTSLAAALTAFFLVLPAGTAGARDESATAIDRLTSKTVTTSFLEYYPDPSGKLSLEDIGNAPFSERFRPMPAGRPGFGYSHDAYWFRLRITNESKNSIHWYIEWEYPLTDVVDFYLPSPDGFELVTVGDVFPFSTRPFNYRTFIIPVKTAPGSHTLYIRAKTRGALIIAVNAWPAEKFYPTKYGEFKVLWLFYGFMLAMILYNVLIFISLRQKAYLYLSLFTVLLSLYTMVHNGLAFQYLWPDSPSWGNASNPFLAFGASILAIQFARTFLETKKHTPVPDLVLRLLMISGAGNILLMLFIDYFYATQLSTLQVTAAMAALLVTSLLLLRKGNKEALFYLLSWSFLYVTIMLHIARAFGLLERTMLSVWGYYLGGSVMILLLSLGIADKLKLLTMERRKAQDELLKSQRLAAEHLEQKVLERTEDLLRAHEQIENTYEEMKKDLKMARTIQMNILPDPVEFIGGLHFCVEYMPLIEIGGDIYDIWEKKDGTIRILLADATGHGIVASLITMLIKSEYEPLKAECPGPADVIHALNEIFCTRYKSLEIFFTGIVMDINRKDGKLTYCSAGHLTQYLIMNGTIIDLHRTGRAIGIIGGIDCFDRTLELDNRFRIILFTDGLTEELNQDKTSFGDQMLRSLIQSNAALPARDMIREILRRTFMGLHQESRWDDITIIGIE